jgi:predicted nucleotidyltransferase
MPTAREAIARRRAEREARLERARAFAGQLPEELGVAGVVVVGSVARGDFHDRSDIDVVVIAEHLPARPVDRLAALGTPPAGVEPVVWTPDEWRDKARRRDPLAADHGVWLRGAPPG